METIIEEENNIIRDSEDINDICDININTITETFIELLKNENNQYKYKIHYRDYIQNNNDSVEQILIQYLQFLRYEQKTCRCHNEREYPFENSIRDQSTLMLRKLMPEKINEYIRLLEVEKNIVYEKYTNDYGVIINNIVFDLNLIYDNTQTGLFKVSENLHNIYSLKTLNYVYKNKDRVTNLLHYFQCLHY